MQYVRCLELQLQLPSFVCGVSMFRLWKGATNWMKLRDVAVANVFGVSNATACVMCARDDRNNMTNFFMKLIGLLLMRLSFIFLLSFCFI